MNVITGTRSYATYENAVKALQKALGERSLDDVRWFIAAAPPNGRRFVPTLLGAEYIQFAHLGIMVVG